MDLVGLMRMRILMEVYEDVIQICHLVPRGQLKITEEGHSPNTPGDRVLVGDTN
jgi:hypothetical protein